MPGSPRATLDDDAEAFFEEVERQWREETRVATVSGAGKKLGMSVGRAERAALALERERRLRVVPTPIGQRTMRLAMLPEVERR